MKRAHNGKPKCIRAIHLGEKLEISGKSSVMLIAGNATILGYRITPWVQYSLNLELNSLTIHTEGTITHDSLPPYIQPKIIPAENISAVVYVKTPKENRKPINIPIEWQTLATKSSVYLLFRI